MKESKVKPKITGKKMSSTSGKVTGGKKMPAKASTSVSKPATKL